MLNVYIIKASIPVLSFLTDPPHAIDIASTVLNFEHHDIYQLLLLEQDIPIFLEL